MKKTVDVHVAPSPANSEAPDRVDAAAFSEVPYGEFTLNRTMFTALMEIVRKGFIKTPHSVN